MLTVQDATDPVASRYGGGVKDVRHIADIAFKSSFRRFQPCLVLLLLVCGCYGTPRTTPLARNADGGSDAAIDGDGATAGDAAVNGDAAVGSDGATDGDAAVDGGAAMCTDGFKQCNGKCIPASACCGPCSCDGLPNTCGPNRDENCCATVLVTGGTFNRDNDPTFPATVGDFHLDRFEITVGRFVRFVAAGQGLQSTAPQAGSGKSDLDTRDLGWDPAWNLYLATTSQTLATNCNASQCHISCGRHCVTYELHQLVRSLRLLHLGRRPAPDAGRVDLCSGGRRINRRPAHLPVVRPAGIDHR
jgi:hypothetical protein